LRERERDREREIERERERERQPDRQTDVILSFLNQHRQTGKYIEIEGKHDNLTSVKPKQINNKIFMNTLDNLNIRMNEDIQGNVEDTKDVIKSRQSKQDR
jgi:hypothetical protein